MKPITIVVPVLGRPQNAEPFVKSLAGALSSNLVDGITVAFNESDLDSMDAWMDAASGKGFNLHLIPLPDEEGSYACKVNEALRHTDTEWMFLAGDDVRFHDDWASIALGAAVGTKACVIGTNDLANPRVIQGDHSTHTFVRTDYARDLGASWDGPGTVCHDGYHHWYVDDELVTVAKLRDVWVAATGSIVEHRHPYFDQSVAWDQTYALGESRAAEDQATWLERVRRFAPELLSPEEGTDDPDPS